MPTIFSIVGCHLSKNFLADDTPYVTAFVLFHYSDYRPFSAFLFPQVLTTSCYSSFHTTLHLRNDIFGRG